MNNPPGPPGAPGAPENGNKPEDKKDEKKKNPAPAPRSVKRRKKKKGPATAVKIPQGTEVWFIISLFVTNCHVRQCFLQQNASFV